MINYDVDIEVEYEGILYKVVQVLDNDLFLAINKTDYLERKFPLKPLVIPDVR